MRRLRDFLLGWIACMDDDSEELSLPPRAPAPLPRIARFAQPPQDDEPEPPPKAKKPKRKDAAAKIDAPKEKKGILVEETPDLDTYEARRTIRIVLGVTVAGAAALLLLVLFRSLKSNDVAASPEPEPEVATTAGGPLKSTDLEAQVALDDARRFAQLNKADETLKRLHRIVTDYPKTPAANEAREALKRGDDGLPLFVDAPLVIGKKAESTEPPEPPKPTVEAEPPQPSAAPGTSDVVVTAPAAKAEPRRMTGLVMPRANVPPRKLPEGFHARPEVGVDRSGWPWEITSDRDGATLVLVPGGSFKMGNDAGPPPEQPAHPVTLAPYYIDQHEVTVSQFALFQAANGAKPPNQSAARDDLPITNVDWAAASEYAKWAGMSLPTEAQWEFAARTTDGRIHPWGPNPPDWNRPREPKQLDPVMSFPLDMSPFGVFDLAGNAEEWTADSFAYYPRAKEKPAPRPSRTRKAAGKPAHIVVKGGSADWSCAWRRDAGPDAKVPTVGFRCVLNVEAATPSTPTPAGSPATPKSGSGQVPF
jgi:formylglycine-generating enzyme required for sulfatase activity